MELIMYNERVSESIQVSKGTKHQDLKNSIHIRVVITTNTSRRTKKKRRGGYWYTWARRKNWVVVV